MRWVHLPRLLSRLSIHVADFLPCDINRRRREHWTVDEVMIPYTEAVRSLLPSSPSSHRTIKHLLLSFYLTDPYLQSIGHAVENVVESGKTDCLEFTIWADVRDPEYEQCLLFGQRLMSFFRSFPAAFKWLNVLILQNITFGHSDIHNLLNTCSKLELLSLTYCDAEDVILTVDAPNSSLVALEVTTCGFARIDLIQAPSLRRLVCTNWIDVNPPLHFRNAPRLHNLSRHPCERGRSEYSAKKVNVLWDQASPDLKHHRLSLLQIAGFAVDDKLMKYIKLVMERTMCLKRIRLLDQQPCAKCDAMDNNTQSPSPKRWRFPVEEEEKKAIRQQLGNGFSSVEISIG